MRRYSRDEEERIRAQALVREWTRSGLLDASQGAQLAAELSVDLRRTNVYLRAGLALFTLLIVGASVLFVIVGLNLNQDPTVATVGAMGAVACAVLAEVVVTRFRVYRFGVEEALAVGSVLLLAFSAAILTSTFNVLRPGNEAVAAGLLVGAAGGLGLYLRFGFVYAAIGGMACAAAIPFQMRVPATARHLLAAITLVTVLAVVRSKRLRYRDDYPGDEYGLLQAAAWAGLYLTLNLQLAHSLDLGTPPIEGIFYWLTYAVTWVLPVVGLRAAIGEKDRPLLDVSLAMALVTLLTNKAYLGWPRHEWDPILLGVFLIGASLALRRWLSRAPDGRRGGFTAQPVLNKDREIPELLGAASLRFQPDTSGPTPRPGPSDFEGGRSGGGGATGTF